MFDIRNEKHVEDKSVLFIEEERLDDCVAGILRQEVEQGDEYSYNSPNIAVRIYTGDESEYVTIDTAEDAEYLVKALQKAASEGWWEA